MTSMDGKSSTNGHLVLAVTVLLFLTVKNSFIAYTVSFNGFVYHVSEYMNLKATKAYKIVDIVCNFSICAWVNLSTKWQPYTICASLVSLAAWQINRTRTAPSCLLHLLFVQSPLLVAAHHYT